MLRTCGSRCKYMDPLIQDPSPCHRNITTVATIMLRTRLPSPVRFSQLQPMVTVDAGFASVIKAVTWIDGQFQTRTVSRVCSSPSAYLPVPPLQPLRSCHGFQAIGVEDIQCVSLFISIPRCLQDTNDQSLGRWACSIMEMLCGALSLSL